MCVCVCVINLADSAGKKLLIDDKVVRSKTKLYFSVPIKEFKSPFCCRQRKKRVR